MTIGDAIVMLPVVLFKVAFLVVLLIAIVLPPSR